MTPSPPPTAPKELSKPVLFGLGLFGLFALGLALLIGLDQPEKISDAEIAALIEARPSAEPLPQYYYETQVTQYAAVAVETNPTGAFVTLNEEITGLSPLRLDQLRPGYYAIRIDHPGHLPIDTTLYIASGAARHLALDLEPRPLAAPSQDGVSEREEIRLAQRAAAGGRSSTSPARADAGTRPQAPTFARADPEAIRRAWTTGSLTVTSAPSGARIAIDGQPRGSAPLTLAELQPGSYRVSVSLPGHAPQTYQVMVAAGAVSRVEAKLAASR